MVNILVLKKKKVKLRFLSGGNLFSFIISISLFLTAGCGSGNNDMNTDAPQGMHAVDLTGYGLPILVHIPESTSSSLEITENPQGGANLRVGENIYMTIIEGPGDMALKKNDITHDDVRRFVKYIIEEPNAIVWEWQIEGMEPELHFYTIIKAGEKYFEIHDVEGEIFSEKSVLQMLELTKSIRLKEPDTAGS